MKTWRASIFGILGISALVAAAAWLPNHPECTRWPLTFLSPDGADGGPARLVAVHRVGWAGDGQMLFSISRGESGAEEYLTLHDTTRGNRAARIDAVGEPVVCGALSPDGLHLAVGTPARGLLWIDLKTRDEIVLAEPGRPQEFTAVAVAGDGGLIAAATTSGQIYLCTPGQRTSVILASPRESAISDVRFSRDGARLVSAQACGTVSVWETATGKRPREFTGKEPATNAEFLVNGTRIIAASLDDKVRIWEIDSGELICCREAGLYGVSALAVSPDGGTAAWGGFGHSIALWDVASMRTKVEIDTPAAVVLHLQFAPDGSSLAAAGMEAIIRRYDVPTGVELESAAIDVSQAGRVRVSR